ncbi:MAG: arylsulfatase [Bryobacterales bacterium]
MKTRPISLLRAAGAFYGLFCAALLVAADRPNVVIVLADDLGWGDPRCYQADSKVPTPNIDRLSREGVRFTDAHTPSAVCSPTRYSLLTGRYSWRTRLKSSVLDGFDPPLIEQGEDTLASMLKRAGYRTACIGKWHLGMTWHDKKGDVVGIRPRRARPGDDVDYTRVLEGGPVDVGFDTYFGIAASLDMSPYCFIRNRSVVEIPTTPRVDEHDDIFMGLSAGMIAPHFRHKDVLPTLAEEAERIIGLHANKPEPFFLYMPLTSPHLPIVPNADARGQSQTGRYGDFVVETDKTLGRVLDALDRNGVASETLVIFTSDNGGLRHSWDFRADDDGGKVPLTKRGEYTKDFDHHSNAQWRGTKADIWEGGHRVPFLVRWPGRIAPGRVSDKLLEVTDIYATLADLLGVERQGTSGMDSFSFLPLLAGDAPGRPFAIHHSIAGVFAVRKGDWKMIEGRGSGGFTQPRVVEGGPGNPAGQLYNLARDPQERSNAYVDKPEIVAQLMKILDAVRTTSATATAGKH